jgi:lipocalin-like protein
MQTNRIMCCSALLLVALAVLSQQPASWPQREHPTPNEGVLLGAANRGLVGTWRLVSWQVITENQSPQDLFGAHPKGYLVLTREGRSIVLTTAENRRAGMGDSERAALHKSMLAYSGRYRIEGRDFITVVDISWNEEWNGTEQRRHFRLEGDKLLIESAAAPSILFPGKTDFRRIVWEREK